MAQAAPFDRILVTAACPEMPVRLIEQLADGGVLLAPVGSVETQTLVRIIRRIGGWREDWLIACRFVKLKGRFGWSE